MILEKINLKKDKLKTKIKPSFKKPLLPDPDVLAYLATLHGKYVIFPIDKASNNFAFVPKKFYISKILSEMRWGERGGGITTSNTIQHIQKQAFLKILLTIMKAIAKNLTLN